MKMRVLSGLMMGLVLCSAISCKVTKGKTSIGTDLSGPSDIAFIDANTMVVANANSVQNLFYNASLAVFDISNPTVPLVIGSVLTDLFNARLAFDPVTLPNQLFMTNRFSANDEVILDQVVRFDTQNPRPPTLQDSTLTADDPYGISIAAAGPHIGDVFVAHASFNGINHFAGGVPNSEVSSIFLTIPGNDGKNCIELAVSPGGEWVAVTCVTSNTLYILDLTPPDDYTVEAVLWMSSFGFNVTDMREIVWIDATSFAFTSRSLGRVFFVDLAVVNEGLPLPDNDDEEIDQIFIDTQNTPGFIEVPLNPFGGAYSLARVGNRLFVSEYYSNDIAQIDLTTFEVGMPIFCGGQGPVAVRVGPDGQHLYVANSLSNNIGVIDIDTDQLVGHFP